MWSQMSEDFHDSPLGSVVSYPSCIKNISSYRRVQKTTCWDAHPNNPSKPSSVWSHQASVASMAEKIMASIKVRFQAPGDRTQKMWGWVKFSRGKARETLRGFPWWMVYNGKSYENLPCSETSSCFWSEEIYIYILYISIYLYTHLFCSGEPDVLWFPTRLWALFSREPTVLHLKCSRHGIRDLDKFTSAGHHCVNAHVYVYIDAIHCIHTQYIYIYIHTHIHIMYMIMYIIM